MDKNITISVKGLVAAGLVLLLVLVAYLLGQNGAGTAAAVADDGGSADQPRSLTMRGVGKVTAVPDEVAFDVAVSVTRDDISTALDDTTEVLDGVLDTLADQGVAQEDTETTGLQMNPKYVYVKRQREFRGFTVTQSLAVLVKDFDNAGAAISAVVSSGGNAVRVNDIRLRISDPESALADARTKAVEEANTKAQAYADASGVSLGSVRTLVEVDPQQVSSQLSRSYQSYDLAATADSVAPISISAGQSDVAVTVQIVWDLD